MMLHTSKNKNNLYSIFKFDKNIEVSLAYFFFVTIIIFPTNILLTKSLQLIIPNNPFYKYLGNHDSMLSFPISAIILFYLSYLLISKKLFFQSNFKFIILSFIYFISFIFISIYFFNSFDLRLLKNIFNFSLMIFALYVFINFKFSNLFLIYTIYSFLISLICIFNLFNLILFYNSFTNYYFSAEGYLSGYLNLYITHFMDYFPFVVFMSIALDILFYKNNKKLIFLLILVKLYWYFVINTYSLELAGGILNKGLLVSIIFLIISKIILKIINISVTHRTIFISILLINIIFLLYLIFDFNNLEPSIKDRAEPFSYLIENISFFNMLFPVLLKFGFEHNLHNDFWDLYFSFGIIFLVFYYYLSKILYQLFEINKNSFLIIFSAICIGSLVQNNLLNIYTFMNLAFILSILINSKKNKI